MCNTQPVVIDSTFSVAYTLKEVRFFTGNPDQVPSLKYPFISFNSAWKILNCFSNCNNIFFGKIAYLPECENVKCVKFFADPSSDSADDGQIICFFFPCKAYSIVVDLCFSFTYTFKELNSQIFHANQFYGLCHPLVPFDPA